MRPELQRIETALAQLDRNPRELRNPRRTQLPLQSQTRNPSFSLAKPVQLPPSQAQLSQAQLSQAPSRRVSFPQPYQSQLTTLPRLQSAQISTHRHGVNPALATNLLKEIEEITLGWQRELKRVLIAIQDLYLEGPIVDGWLESQSPLPDRPSSSSHSFDLERFNSPDRPGYRLCGLDENGRLWSRTCPPEQVAGVSVAIARYQKLRQLLKSKQSLENRLSNLAETLVMVHGKLKEEV
jgi:type II secretory pathway component PulJ